MRPRRSTKYQKLKKAPVQTSHMVFLDILERTKAGSTLCENHSKSLIFAQKITIHTFGCNFGPQHTVSDYTINIVTFEQHF